MPRGAGGLTLGIELQRRGLDVQLYEQTSVLREVGAAVSLSASATRFYDERFGLAEPLGAVSAEVDGLIFRDGRTGEQIARLSSHDEYRSRFGASFLDIHRADLQSILFSALDPESLHLSTRVVEIDDSGSAAVLHFADGERAEERNARLAAPGAFDRHLAWVHGFRADEQIPEAPRVAD